MKKALDYILFFCLLVIVAHIVMYMMADYPSRHMLNENKEFFENLANREPEDPTRGDARYSVLVLSFNQNEKPDTLAPKKAKLYYDFEGKGLAVETGWVKPKAGILVIDQGRGPKLLGYDGSGSCGFDYLAQADANGDGLIDARDPIWSDLRVWMDKNSNGRMNDRELFSLSDLNIMSLELKRQSENQHLIDGNFIREAGVFHFGDLKDGRNRAGRLDEIFLRQHSNKVKFLKPIEVPAEIAAMVPDIPGSGLVRNLREAAALNPELVSLSTRLVAANDDEQRWARLDELMTAWAKTGGLEETVEKRIGDQFNLLDNGLSGPEGAELARRLSILDAWRGHYLVLLPHELNPVQLIRDQIVGYNTDNGEISINYQPMRESIDAGYYWVTHNVFREFFPDSDSIRPSTEDLINSDKADDPEAVQ